MSNTNKQVRIFAPSTAHSDKSWGEQILGEVIKPIIEKYNNGINWFWFSRYGTTKDGDIGDCEIGKVLPEFFNNNFHISMRFRISVKNDSWNDIKRECDELILKIGHMHTGWLDYNVVADLGRNRFAPQEFGLPRREKRAELIVNYLCDISKLVLDCIKRNDVSGKWEYEDNTDKSNNPLGSIFESLVHLLCNSTNAYLPVILFKKKDEILAGTPIYPLPAEDGWEKISGQMIGF